MAAAGNFSGKKALVFGGTSGIGLATVNQLKAQGAEVVAISRDPSKAGDIAGVTLAACDVRDTDALAELLAQHAPFDLLISAATGGSRAAGPFLQMDLAAYQASFDKLWGYTNIVRLGAEHLTEKGAIVLVSGAPARRAKPGQAALASVGGAVEQFARAVAPELAPRRINVVSPGVIDTPMFGPDAEARAKMLGAATANNLIPRAGTPDEVAEAVIFVAGNEFVTGTTVEVDGGWILS
ncbi:MAG TPA: short-chain dehydrogenase [Gammaproteobacteria bacterium]|nr:short-chain dehydrogenase [Gammaproteobacteria bacterium]HBF64333.1 short-chain dehydrogenase [Gammaproteobacteria bacterium]HBK11445.1 short-chain dehydrogenase [Gammaproteobacteria bacterium]|tara:strand:+ start:12101 stop:12814 length:714 start_codon:yes stop_codon:yes gene_type:complete